MFDAITDFFWGLIYDLCTLLCWIVQCIYETFEIFAGLRYVKLNGEDTVMFDVFFNNDSIAYIYWGMATIGIILCFVFALIAVIRKMFDSEDKMQTTMGAIIGAMIKSILLILSMNFIMTVVIHSTTLLLQQVDYIFAGGKYAGTVYGKTIEFDEEDYATMARIYNTIGNYSLNSSNESRVNVNSCFNDIRKDMLLLEKKNVFDFDYRYVESGKAEESWQSILTDIAKARSLDSDIPIDEYDEDLVKVITNTMKLLQSETSIKALSMYKAPDIPEVNEETRLDAIIVLTGTMRAADNPKYNKNPGIMDPLRAPYITGQKDIYDYDQIKDDFNVGDLDFILIIIAACFFGYQLISICMNTIGRIFNMIILYLIAPPILAASPLDGGGKFKQWTTAFVVQTLSIFATLMAMRLITFFIPIIYSGDLVLFEDSGFRNYFIRLFFVITLGFTANKSIGMISGILADSAGWQAINAGNVGDGVRNDIETFGKTMKGIFGGDKKDKAKGEGKEEGKGEGKGKDGSSGGQPKNNAGSGEKDSGSLSNNKGSEIQQENDDKGNEDKDNPTNNTGMNETDDKGNENKDNLTNNTGMNETDDKGNENKDNPTNNIGMNETDDKGNGDKDNLTNNTGMNETDDKGNENKDNPTNNTTMNDNNKDGGNENTDADKQQVPTNNTDMKQQQQEDNQEETNQHGGGSQGSNPINQGGVADQQGDNNQGHNNPSVAGNTIPNNNANTGTQKTVAGNGPAPAGGNNTMENMGVNPPNVDPIKKPPVIENNNKLN